MCIEDEGDPYCYVATAVYGDRSREVTLLRGWRDEVLATIDLKNLPLRMGIHAYYSGAGKKVARLLERDWPAVTPAVRRGLDILVNHIVSRKRSKAFSN